MTEHRFPDDRDLAALVPDRVWTRRIPLRFYLWRMGTRMTVVRLAEGPAAGGLFVHSPVRLDAETKAQVDALGSVRFVVAPNRLHHLFVAEWIEAYPHAQAFCSPVLAHKRAEVDWDGVLGEAAEPGWSGEIDQQPLDGFGFIDEVLFFDRPSRTLMVTDVLQHVTVEDPLWERIWSRLIGFYGHPGVARDLRVMARDRTAARATVQRVLDWRPDRIVLTHGPVVAKDAAAVLRRAFGWLLDD